MTTSMPIPGPAAFETTDQRAKKDRQRRRSNRIFGALVGLLLAFVIACGVMSTVATIDRDRAMDVCGAALSVPMGNGDLSAEGLAPILAGSSCAPLSDDDAALVVWRVLVHTQREIAGPLVRE